MSGLYQTLANPFYCGLVKYGGQIYEGNHEAMISKEEFQKAQTLLHRHDRHRPQKHRFLYSGLIHCGSCGRLVTGEQHVKKSGKQYVHYRCCRHRGRLEHCLEPHVSEPSLNQQVLSCLERLTIPRPFLDWSLRHLDKWAEQEATTALAKKASLETALAKTEHALSRLTRMSLLEQITDEEYQRERVRLLAEKDRFSMAIKTPAATVKRWHEAIRQVLDLGAAAAATFDTASKETKRTLLAAVASNYTLRDRILAVQWEKPFAVIAEKLPLLQSTPLPASNSDPTPGFALNQHKNRASKGGSAGVCGLWWAAEESDL